MKRYSDSYVPSYMDQLLERAHWVAEIWGLPESSVRRMLYEGERLERAQGIQMAENDPFCHRAGVPALAFYDREGGFRGWLTLDVNRVPDLMFLAPDGKPITPPSKK